MKRRNVLLGCVLGVSGLAACSDEKSGSQAPLETGDSGTSTAIGQQVPWPTTAWTVKTPEDMGMDSALIEEALDYAFENINPPSLRLAGDPERFAFDTLTQGVVIIRGGAIVAERYAGGLTENPGSPRLEQTAPKNKDSWATSWSMGKSFTSTLIGILIDRGDIENVDVPMSTFYPEWANDPGKAAITLRDVLQMQSGLKFSESYTDIECLSNPDSGATCAEFLEMALSPDQLTYMQDRPMDPARTTGETWYYSSGDTLLLAGIVQKLTGKNAFDFGKEVLFDKIGMTSEPLQWWQDGAGTSLGYCCVDTTSRNFGRFGLLFLRDGVWDGEQIVSRDWVRRATTDAAAGNFEYALQWWLPGKKPNTTLPVDLYSAEGQDDQRIWVIPSLDLVVVRNSQYTKNPGPDGQLGTDDDAIAEENLIGEFLINGMTQYSTDTGAFFLECGFLAPIINSIEGGPRIETCNDAASADPNNPEPIFACREGEPTCMERMQARYTPVCDEFQGCMCNNPDFAAKLATCDDNCGCREILQCAFETQCFINAAFDCLTPCQSVIDANGGVSGVPTTLAVDVALAFDTAAANGCTKECP